MISLNRKSSKNRTFKTMFFNIIYVFQEKNYQIFIHPQKKMGTNGGSLRMSFVSLKEYASCRYLLNLNKCNILFIFTGNPSEKSLKRPATAGSQFKVSISLHIHTTSIKTHSQNTLQVPSRFCITKISSTGTQVFSFWYFGCVFVWLNYV